MMTRRRAWARIAYDSARVRVGTKRVIYGYERL